VTSGQVKGVWVFYWPLAPASRWPTPSALPSSFPLLFVRVMRGRGRGHPFLLFSALTPRARWPWPWPYLKSFVLPLPLGMSRNDDAHIKKYNVQIQRQRQTLFLLRAEFDVWVWVNKEQGKARPEDWRVKIIKRWSVFIRARSRPIKSKWAGRTHTQNGSLDKALGFNISSLLRPLISYLE
jgi:hypothetical protein